MQAGFAHCAITPSLHHLLSAGVGYGQPRNSLCLQGPASRMRLMSVSAPALHPLVGTCNSSLDIALTRSGGVSMLSPREQAKLPRGFSVVRLLRPRVICREAIKTRLTEELRVGDFHDGMPSESGSVFLPPYMRMTSPSCSMEGSGDNRITRGHVSAWVGRCQISPNEWHVGERPEPVCECSKIYYGEEPPQLM